MLFTVKRNVALPDGSETVVDIIIGANSPINPDTYFSAEQLVTDVSLLESYASIGDIKIAVLNDSRIIYPILDAVYNTNEVEDVTAVMNLISNNLKKLNTAALTSTQNKVLVSQLVNKIGLQQDMAVSIVYYCQNFMQYERVGEITGPLNFGPGSFDKRFFVKTQAFLDEINSAYIWPFKSIQPADNKTLFQETCTDSLFLEFPNRNNMLEESAKLSSYLPKLSELCNPYGMYDIPDISEYKTNPKFPEHLYSWVEGVASNNTYELYENEKTYYQAIIEWVQFNMKRSTVGDIDVSPENPNIDSLSQGYLEEVCKLLYTKHWYHNLNIPIYAAISEDEEDLTDLLDDSSSSDAVVSDYIFRATAEEKRAASSGIREMVIDKSSRVNALEKLLEFLREASLTVGYQAYAQAIIQLARWGERKPTCIVIKGYAWIFSLGNNKVKPYMGNIQDYTLEMIDGCPLEANAALYDSVSLKCKKFLMEHNYPYSTITAPVGLMTTKTLINNTNNGPKKINSYLVYSIIDVVESYVNGDNKLKIAGISYDGSTFSASANIDLDNRNTYFSAKSAIKEEDNLEAPFKSSANFEDLIMELDIRANKILTHFDILDSCAIQEDLDHFIELNQFSSKEDLDYKVKNAKIRSKVSAFIYSYGAKLLPIYVKASLRLNELESSGKTITFADVLNVYKEVMEVNTLSIFNTPEGNAENSNTQQMNFFGNTEVNKEPVKEVANTPTEQVSTAAATTNIAATTIPVEHKFSFLHNPEETAAYMKILDNAGNLVGGARVEIKQVHTSNGAVKNVKAYTLVTADSLKSVDINAITTTMEISNIVYRLMFNLYSYECNNEEQILLYFDSIQTMVYYTKLINQLGKEKRL